MALRICRKDVRMEQDSFQKFTYQVWVIDNSESFQVRNAARTQALQEVAAFHFDIVEFDGFNDGSAQEHRRARWLWKGSVESHFLDAVAESFHHLHALESIFIANVEQFAARVSS
jgi:hypothetical protein